MVESGRHWAIQVHSLQGVQSTRLPGALSLATPGIPGLGFHTRDCHGAGLGCGLGGQPQKTPGWFQAQPGLRTLAVAPCSFDLGALFCRRTSWETAVSSVLWLRALHSPLLFGPTSFLSEPSASPLCLGYLMVSPARCFLRLSPQDSPLGRCCPSLQRRN